MRSFTRAQFRIFQWRVLKTRSNQDFLNLRLISEWRRFSVSPNHAQACDVLLAEPHHSCLKRNNSLPLHWRNSTWCPPHHARFYPVTKFTVDLPLHVCTKLSWGVSSFSPALAVSEPVKSKVTWGRCSGLWK